MRDSFCTECEGTSVIILFSFGGRGDIFFFNLVIFYYLKIFYADVVGEICLDIPSTFSSVSIHCHSSLSPLVDRRVTAKAAICKTFTGV